MSLNVTNKIIINSDQAMQEFGKSIGNNLKGGEFIELMSDLGGGKTTLVKGIAKGAGTDDHVSSPTFTIRNDYRAKRFNIAHIDLYRLDDPGIIESMLVEVLNNTNIVTIIEWGESLKRVFPVQRIKISFSVISLTSRELLIERPTEFNYLFEGLKVN